MCWFSLFTLQALSFLHVCLAAVLNLRAPELPAKAKSASNVEGQQQQQGKAEEAQEQPEQQQQQQLQSPVTSANASPLDQLATVLLSGQLPPKLQPVLTRVELGVKTKAQLVAERHVLVSLLTAVIAAGGDERVAEKALPFSRGICRHFAMLFVAGATAPPPAPMMSRITPAEGGAAAGGAAGKGAAAAPGDGAAAGGAEGAAGGAAGGAGDGTAAAAAAAGQDGAGAAGGAGAAAAAPAEGGAQAAGAAPPGAAGGGTTGSSGGGQAAGGAAAGSGPTGSTPAPAAQTAVSVIPQGLCELDVHLFMEALMEVLCDASRTRALAAVEALSVFLTTVMQLHEAQLQQQEQQQQQQQVTPEGTEASGGGAEGRVGQEGRQTAAAANGAREAEQGGSGEELAAAVGGGGSGGGLARAQSSVQSRAISRTASAASGLTSSVVVAAAAGGVSSGDRVGPGGSSSSGGDDKRPSAKQLGLHPVLDELLPRILHCCWEDTWSARLGGVAAVKLLVRKLPAKYLAGWSPSLVSALCTVIKGLPEHSTVELKELEGCLKELMGKCFDERSDPAPSLVVGEKEGAAGEDVSTAGGAARKDEEREDGAVGDGKGKEGEKGVEVKEVKKEAAEGKEEGPTPMDVDKNGEGQDEGKGKAGEESGAKGGEQEVKREEEGPSKSAGPAKTASKAESIGEYSLYCVLGPPSCNLQHAS